MAQLRANHTLLLSCAQCHMSLAVFCFLTSRTPLYQGLGVAHVNLVLMSLLREWYLWQLRLSFVVYHAEA